MGLGNKIAVVGAGAIGRLIAGLLGQAGEDVTLIARRKSSGAIHRDGLAIKGVAGEYRVRIKTALRLGFKPDIVFIAVQTQDLAAVCHEIRPNVSGTPIVLLENGVRSSSIAASILEKENLISCVLLLNARYLNAGGVIYVNRKPSVIGTPYGQIPEGLAVAKGLLQHVSDTVISTNIQGAQWTKLLINAMSNSIDALTGLTLGEYIKSHGLRRIAVLILREALEATDTAHIALENLPGVPVSLLKALIKLPSPIAAALLRYAFLTKGSSDIITSTLQSIRRNRQTEIEYINGEFVKLGRRIGIRTPYNTKVVELIHRIEKSHPFFTPQELIHHFSSL